MATVRRSECRVAFACAASALSIARHVGRETMPGRTTMPGGIPCRYGLTCAGGLHGSRKRWRKRLVAYQRVRTAYTNFALRVRHVRERLRSVALKRQMTEQLRLSLLVLPVRAMYNIQHAACC